MEVLSHIGKETVSNMVANDKGRFANSWAVAEGAQLIVTVQCMTLRID